MCVCLLTRLLARLGPYCTVPYRPVPTDEAYGPEQGHFLWEEAGKIMAEAEAAEKEAAAAAAGGKGGGGSSPTAAKVKRKRPSLLLFPLCCVLTFLVESSMI